jgi:hypothetical protein
MKTGFPRFCHIHPGDPGRVNDLDIESQEQHWKDSDCSFHASRPTACDTRGTRSVKADEDGGRDRKKTDSTQNQPEKYQTRSESGIGNGSPLDMTVTQHNGETVDHTVPVNLLINVEGIVLAFTLSRRRSSLQSEFPPDSVIVQDFKNLAKSIPVVRKRPSTSRSIMMQC